MIFLTAIMLAIGFTICTEKPAARSFALIVLVARPGRPPGDDRLEQGRADQTRMPGSATRPWPSPPWPPSWESP